MRKVFDAMPVRNKVTFSGLLNFVEVSGLKPENITEEYFILKWINSMVFAWIESPYVGKETNDKSDAESMFGFDVDAGLKLEIFTVVLQFCSMIETEPDNEMFDEVESPNYENLAQENDGLLDIQPMEVDIEDMKLENAAKSAGDEDNFVITDVPCDVYFLDENLTFQEGMVVLCEPDRDKSELKNDVDAEIEKIPYWLSSSEVGVYGKPAPEDYTENVVVCDEKASHYEDDAGNLLAYIYPSPIVVDLNGDGKIELVTADAEDEFVDDEPQCDSVLSDDLCRKITKQVEYYFSDENFPNDKFLMKYVSKNAEGYVPVGIIATFRKLKKLTRDISFVLAALRESDLLVVSSNGKIQEQEAPKIGTVFGIDLGTTSSCVGVYKNAHVEIVANDQGIRITPSWVAFTDCKRLTGEAAKNQTAVNPERTVFDVKRLIGMIDGVIRIGIFADQVCQSGATRINILFFVAESDAIIDKVCCQVGISWHLPNESHLRGACWKYAFHAYLWFAALVLRIVITGGTREYAFCLSGIAEGVCFIIKA